VPPTLALILLFQEGFGVLFCAGIFQRRGRSQWRGALLGLLGLAGVLALPFAFRRAAAAPTESAPVAAQPAFDSRARLASEPRTRIPA
jgi:hypothetical protein